MPRGWSRRQHTARRARHRRTAGRDAERVVAGLRAGGRAEPDPHRSARGAGPLPAAGREPGAPPDRGSDGRRGATTAPRRLLGRLGGGSCSAEARRPRRRPRCHGRSRLIADGRAGFDGGSRPRRTPSGGLRRHLGRAHLSAPEPSRARGGDHRLTETTRYRSFNGARRGLYVFANLLKLGQYGLALDAEFLCQLVYAGLACHCTPHSEVVRATRIDLTCPLEAWSFQRLHRVLMLVVLPCCPDEVLMPHHRSCWLLLCWMLPGAPR
jgi:hypothetical protein